MNCHDSTYSGFSFADAKRHRTVPRPASNIPVRKLRRSYAGSGAVGSGEEVEEVEEVEETVEAGGVNPVIQWMCWFLAGYLVPEFFMYWAVITAVFMLATPAKYYLPAAAIMLTFKIAMGL